jgi:hypothetical protein
MSTNPQYTVTPLDGVQHAVRIETLVPQSPFHDESYPVILQALAPEALPLMQAFLSGLSLNTSWTSREARCTVDLSNCLLPNGRTELSLKQCTDSRRTPDAWYGLLVGENEDSIIELNVLNERLATQLLNALRAGSLVLRLA